MTGWKTIFGGVLIGLAGVVEALKFTAVLDPALADTIATIIASIGAGFGVVGIGHKIEKAGGGQ
jgi:hypothetical protein